MPKNIKWSLLCRKTQVNVEYYYFSILTSLIDILFACVTMGGLVCHGVHVKTVLEGWVLFLNVDSGDSNPGKQVGSASAFTH